MVPGRYRRPGTPAVLRGGRGHPANRFDVALEVDRRRAVLLDVPGLFEAVHHALVGEVAILLRIEQLHPGIRPDPVLRLPDDVELPLLVSLADSRPQPGMVVLLVDLHLA